MSVISGHDTFYKLMSSYYCLKIENKTAHIVRKDWNCLKTAFVTVRYSGRTKPKGKQKNHLNNLFIVITGFLMIQSV